MRTGTTPAVLMDALERCDTGALPGRAAATKNSILRSLWPLSKPVAAVPPARRVERERRRLR
jgi:hypothetical protein